MLPFRCFGSSKRGETDSSGKGVAKKVGKRKVGGLLTCKGKVVKMEEENEGLGKGAQILTPLKPR